MDNADVTTGTQGKERTMELQFTLATRLAPAGERSAATPPLLASGRGGV